MSVEIGIEFVAYTMILGLPPAHHKSGFRASLHILDDEPRDEFQVLDVYFVNHLVLVVDFKIFITFVLMNLKPFIVSLMLDSEKSSKCMVMNPENSKSSLMLHKPELWVCFFYPDGGVRDVRHVLGAYVGDRGRQREFVGKQTVLSVLRVDRTFECA